MILEIAILTIRQGQSEEFEKAFHRASPLIASIPGYIRHALQHCIETPNRYVLLVDWESIEAHTIGFRGSPAFQEWRQQLHHFYEPSPVVEHYQQVLRYPVYVISRGGTTASGSQCRCYR